MKLISWNVNGLRACLTKGFLDFVQAEQPDILALQETKMQPEQVNFDLPGYQMYFNSAEKKGYSGTAVFLKEPPLAVTFGMGIEEHDHEGRVITVEYPGYYFVTVYTPNSQDGLRRLEYRMTWEDAFLAYLKGLDEKKPVIVCGDLNVAHEEIDIKNPKSNRMNAGFTDEERAKMTVLLKTALRTPSAASTRTPGIGTPGGAIASTPGRTMRDGASNTFWSVSGSWGRSATA